MWENQRFALLKQAFQPTQASWLVRFGKGRVSKNKNFPAKKKANRKI